ncbi:beta strand repeat-containing protein [Clostridium estertheticum]|uniref:beta strand repeat-containing protein n=1 Tax=Clostridium estertheticum TaxID=238834 RepID=UPI001C7CD289|nr:cell wall-binding repeat-containing protein [Clostridium estertheticum]MBX4264108.1 cell wall-binding repeat-containing protein [Clostridium estertheticum]WLC87211.1 cell wall-binding repeat-containing protein [Clostridium estertheticum]
MNKKITSTALAALMIAGSTSFSAFAAMDSGTVVIGTKAFDLAYANDPANATEISAAINAGGTVYVKDFNGNWLDNITGASVNASVIPAVTYTNSKGSTQIGAGDASTVAATSATVSAVAADQLKVTFNGAVADTAKVSFDVAAKGGAAVGTTVTWNTAKTEAILSKAAKFNSGDYTVAVTNDKVAFGTSTITFAEQKLAKISITSTKLGVVNSTKNGVTTQTGYATYVALDQYGVDVTRTSLANNIQFQTGVGDITYKSGLITITPAVNLNLMTFTSGVTITGTDSSTGVSASATLMATSQIGTLSDISLSGLTNKDNKVLTAGDTTDVFYAGFTATDISGNPTTNYTLMQKGLIMTGVNNDELTTSSSNVTAKLVQDPKDSTQGLIEVKASINTITIDQPLVITAMTWTGKTSQISTTLKKQAEVNKFTLQSPSDSIASGEEKEIPFTAEDQNGVKITKYSDLNGYVTLTGAYFVRNLDGSASVKNYKVTNSSTTSVPDVITSSTKLGSFSSITINIQKPVVADTLALDTTVLKTTLQNGGATEKADFGYDKGGFAIKDQYGREIDMTTASDSDYANYVIVPTSSNTTAVTATGTATVGEKQIVITSAGVGSSTVTFNLYNLAQKNAAGTTIFTGSNYSALTSLDSKSQTFSVLANDDIKDYTLETVTAPIYISSDMTADAADAVTKQEADYAANPEVFGTTSTGGKVVLSGTPVTGASSSSDDFTVFNLTGRATKSDDVKIIANPLSDKAKTGSSTTLSVSFIGADGNSYTRTTPITSTTVKPVAATMDVSVKTELAGITRSDDTITITGNYATILGGTLAEYYKGQTLVSGLNGKEGAKNIYFAPVDQYGKKAYSLSQFTLVPSGTNLHGHTFDVDNNGNITGASNLVTGDYITVAGSTANGLVKTIRINFGASAVSTTIDQAKAAVVLAETTPTQANYNAAVLAVDGLSAADKLTTETALRDRLVIVHNTLVGLGVTDAATALAAVNSATSVATMETALVNKDLGLAPAIVTAFKSFTSYNQGVVAQNVLTNMPAKGYLTPGAIETVMNTSSAVRTSVIETIVTSLLGGSKVTTPVITTVGTTNTATTTTAVSGTLGSLAGTVNMADVTAAVSNGATSATIGGTTITLATATPTNIKLAVANAVLGTTTATVTDYDALTVAQLKAYTATAGNVKVNVSGVDYNVVLN